jgi:serine/threonine-protein kinase
MTDLHEQLQASLGDAYTIERELGGGGMSRVFVAEEKSLGRQVVVKVLPADLSGGVSIARFRREISLAARLQHPHIVPLLATGEIDGLPYYVMPLVDGESLRVRLSHGELPIADTISILRDVAKALAYAHGKGVAHRDIKPDNVLLTGTSAVITDFGVAKALSDATVGGTLTSIGVALGTPAYMAPEQATADPSMDLRADFYAFGATAYEMLAGHTPFAGRSAQAMLAAHATEAAPSIAMLRPATPASLADLVTRCLEKRPGDRPQTASDIVHALEGVALSSATPTATRAHATRTHATRPRSARVAAGVLGLAVGLIALAAWWRARTPPSAGSEIRSIAVLPFENTSGDTAFDYLEDGVTDHVRDALNVMPGLTVKARGSSRQLKGRGAREIGTTLGVGAVLQGAVSRSSTRLHVTAELVRTSDDGALWSATFDRSPNEFAGIQDTIVRAVAGTLRIDMADARIGRTTAGGARGTNNGDAFDDFIRARHAFDFFDFPRAIPLLRSAIDRDPSFARAHAFLAMAYANTPTLGLGSVDSLNALARASASRALALDSTTVEAYVAESFVLTGEMRFVEALTPLQKALRLDSTNTDVLLSYGLGLAQVGRVPEGMGYLRRARQLDPRSQTVVGLLGYMFELSRQYDSALAMTAVARDLDPTNALIHQGRGFLYSYVGMPDSAVAEFEQAFKLSPTYWNGRSNLVFGYAVAGRWNDVARQRALFEREPVGNSPHYPQLIVDLAYGDYDAAMKNLELGVETREPLFGVFSIPCDPELDPLKSNPRFAALMQRLGMRACPPAGKWPIAARPR